MPRQAKGARLYLRSRKGRESVWVIVDGENEVSTGCGERDCGEAEKALARYIASKHKPDWQRCKPWEVMVADVLGHYGEQKAPHMAHPELVGFHMVPLLQFFGEMTCWDIGAETCNNYVERRTAGELGRKVKRAIARRELVTLSAALTFAHDDKKPNQPVNGCRKMRLECGG